MFVEMGDPILPEFTAQYHHAPYPGLLTTAMSAKISNASVSKDSGTPFTLI